MKKLVFILLLLLIINLIPVALKAQVWDSLGTDLRGSCRFHAIQNNKLVVCIKDSINSMYLSGIGFWDGTSWDTLGAGIDGAVYTSTEFGGNLYLGGNFKYVGGASFPDTSADNLTYWDGSQYHITDYRNPGANVQALSVYNNELYVGAHLSFIVNGITYSGIARYNGTNWNDVGGGVSGSFKEVICMTHFNGDLIVAGRFDNAGTTQAYNIARWDGNQWYSMGDGFNYYVRSLFVDSVNNELYAGGSFTHSGSTLVNFIAKWDGFTWQPVGNGLGNFIQAITKYKGALYAGTSPNLNPSPLMRFDGTNWLPVVPSPNKLVYCLNVFQDELYVSGSMTSIGGIPYAGIARYRDTITSVQPINSSEKLFEIFPNPTKSKLEIIVTTQIKDSFKIIITDATGKHVIQKEYLFNPINIELNLPEELKNGMYTCQISGEDFKYSENFLIQH